MCYLLRRNGICCQSHFPGRVTIMPTLKMPCFIFLTTRHNNDLEFSQTRQIPLFLQFMHVKNTTYPAPQEAKVWSPQSSGNPSPTTGTSKTHQEVDHPDFAYAFSGTYNIVPFPLCLVNTHLSFISAQSSTIFTLTTADLSFTTLLSLG